MWQPHAGQSDESRDFQRISPLPPKFSFISSSLSTSTHKNLFTFVLDQHALQRGTGCDLAQPQFPVHPLPWFAQLSKETLWVFSTCCAEQSSFTARLCLFRLRWWLKSTSAHSPDKRKKKQQLLLQTISFTVGVQMLYTKKSQGDEDPTDKVFTHAVLEWNHLNFWSNISA